MGVLSFRAKRRVSELDERRFQTAYDDHIVAIRRYAARLSGSHEQGSDVAQETFARLWTELRDGRVPDRMESWLYRVATNLVVDSGRARTRSTRLLEVFGERETRVPSPERGLITKDIVREALARVPEPMRQCLLLSHEGLTGKEIADVLGVQASYVPTLVLRAHRRFRRECLAFGDPDDLLR